MPPLVRRALVVLVTLLVAAAWACDEDGECELTSDVSLLQVGLEHREHRSRTAEAAPSQGHRTKVSLLHRTDQSRVVGAAAGKKHQAEAMAASMTGPQGVAAAAASEAAPAARAAGAAVASEVLLRVAREATKGAKPTFPASVGSSAVALIAISDLSTINASANASDGLQAHRAELVTELLVEYAGAAGCIWSVALAPDASRLATGSCDGKLRLYDPTAASGDALLATVEDARDEVGSVAFWRNRKDGTLLLAAASLDKSWRLYNATSTSQTEAPQLLTVKEESGWEVDGVTFAIDSPLLATACAGGDAHLYDIIDPTSPKLQGTVHSMGKTVTTAAIIPHGARMAVGYFDGTLHAVSTTVEGMARADLTMMSDGVINLAYSPDNKLLAAADASGSVQLWDNLMEKGQPMHLLAKVTDAGDRTNSVAFSADSLLMATGSWDRKTRVYDISDPKTPKLMTAIGDATDYIYSVAFGREPTGQVLLATGSRDGKARVYRLNYE